CAYRLKLTVIDLSEVMLTLQVTGTPGPPETLHPPLIETDVGYTGFATIITVAFATYGDSPVDGPPLSAVLSANPPFAMSVPLAPTSWRRWPWRKKPAPVNEQAV